MYESNGEILLEMECFNPECRELNIVSQEFYLQAREDFFHHTKYDVKRTSRLPGEMSVIFNSMERSGISWIVRVLDYEHRYVFRKPIKYSSEISRQRAIEKRFPVPDHWCCVYEVPMEELMQKPYDRIILVERPLEIIRVCIWLYGHSNKMSYEEFLTDRATLNKKITEAHHMLFDKAEEYAKDPRVFHVSLADLNNYSTLTFHSLMDFLNFPTNKRSNLFPVNPPERNWQAYSSMLGKDEEIGARLKNIQEKYGYKNEFIKNLQLILNAEKYYQNGLEIKYQEKHGPPRNAKRSLKTPRGKVPKFTRHEREHQKGLTFRFSYGKSIDALEIDEKFNICVITPAGIKIGCHHGELMHQAFRKLGHNVDMITFRRIKRYGNVQNLSTILEEVVPEKEFDFIFLSECRCKILNDTDIPLFYFHTGWYLPPNVSNANVYYFRQAQLPEDYYQKDVEMGVLPLPANPDSFKPKPKTYKGVHGIGFRKPWGKWEQIVGLIKPFVRVMQKETNDFINRGFHYFHTPIDDAQYRALLPQIEALNPLIAYGEYITRRMMEGMLCKTLLVYRHDFLMKDGKRDDSLHRNMIKMLGYEANKHYIEIKDNSEIKEVFGSFSEQDKEEMRELAYETTLKYNTPIQRAQQVIKDFKDGKHLKGEPLVDSEDFRRQLDAARERKIMELRELEQELQLKEVK